MIINNLDAETDQNKETLTDDLSMLSQMQKEIESMEQ